VGIGGNYFEWDFVDLGVDVCFFESERDRSVGKADYVFASVQEDDSECEYRS